MLEHIIDEFLEEIWLLKENNKIEISELKKSLNKENVDAVVDELQADGLIKIETGRFLFTEMGENRARDLIRRHRLAECLFTEVFEIIDSLVESNACQFEHILTPEVTESLCSFLGHPPTCPHGKPIPKGSCCSKFEPIKPLVSRLIDIEPGQEGKIVFISTKQGSRLHKLGSFGILPGTNIRLHQKQPSVVIQVGETEIALDNDIVSEIYVRRI